MACIGRKLLNDCKKERDDYKEVLNKIKDGPVSSGQAGALRIMIIEVLRKYEK
jgi:hypothetical protein